MKKITYLSLFLCFTLACVGQQISRRPADFALTELELAPPGVSPFKVKHGEKSSYLIVGDSVRISMPNNVWIIKKAASKDQTRALLIAQRFDYAQFWVHEMMIAVYLDEASQSWKIDHCMSIWELDQIDNFRRIFHAVEDVENLPVVVFEVGTIAKGQVGKVNYKTERWNIETGRPEP